MYDEWKPSDATVDDDPTPYWTLGRIILMLIILITLIAFLLYTFSPLITSVLNSLQPEPEPLSIPMQRAQNLTNQILTIYRLS